MTDLPDTNNWFQRAGEIAEARLRSIPRELLGPAGRILMTFLDRKDAE